MRVDGAPLTASIESGEVLYLSRLLRVEPGAAFMVIACSPEKSANSKLLAERVITFRCNHHGVHYEFSSGAPRETSHGGELAIQLTLPVALVALQRRAQARTPVPAGVPLRCDQPLGPASLAASVGIEAGTRIEGALIRHPRRAAVRADLEVRYDTRVALPDGRPANRAGCRILAPDKDLEDLLRLFVTELGEDTK